MKYKNPHNGPAGGAIDERKEQVVIQKSSRKGAWGLLGLSVAVQIACTEAARPEADGILGGADRGSLGPEVNDPAAEASRQPGWGEAQPTPDRPESPGTALCKDAADNGFGYGELFWDEQGNYYRKINTDWAHNSDRAFWCRLEIRRELLSHRGKPLFLSGLNFGWFYFGNDVGCLPEGWGRDLAARQNHFRKFFADASAHGVNLVRFWVHVTGELNPLFDKQGLVQGMDSCFLTDLKWLLDLADEHHVLVNLTLWSHDILIVDESHPEHLRDRAILMLHELDATRAYLKNVLVPMVSALHQHPALFSWEIMNEPEGISRELRLYWGYQYDRIEDNPYHSPEKKAWLRKRKAEGQPVETRQVDVADWQRFVSLCAAVIHKIDSSAKVTVGAHSIPYLTDMPISLPFKYKRWNLYSDGELMTAGYQRSLPILDELLRSVGFEDGAGGDLKLGTLDFYQVHYYEENDAPAEGWVFEDVSVNARPKAHFQMDKPLVVGEFYGTESSVARLEGLLQTGYSGAWGWSYIETRKVPEARRTQWDYLRPIFKTFSLAHPELIETR